MGRPARSCRSTIRGGPVEHWLSTVVAQRRALGLRQADLAALAGVSERFVRELESGKTSVRLDKVEPVLEALGLRLVVAPRETP
nr:helix-turn-helix transcriptional regulator [Ornithinimicrobium sp. HY1745]